MTFPYKLTECLTIEEGCQFGKGIYYLVRKGKRLKEIPLEEVEIITDTFPNLNKTEDI